MEASLVAAGRARGDTPPPPPTMLPPIQQLAIPCPEKTSRLEECNLGDKRNHATHPKNPTTLVATWGQHTIGHAIVEKMQPTVLTVLTLPRQSFAALTSD